MITTSRIAEKQNTHRSQSSSRYAHASMPGSTSTIPPSLLSERVKYLHDYARLATSNPLCAITLTVVMFSIAGIPPLAGFYSKTFLLFASIGSANYVLSVLAIAMSVISAFYYIRIVKIMYFEPNMLQAGRGIRKNMIESSLEHREISPANSKYSHTKTLLQYQNKTEKDRASQKKQDTSLACKNLKKSRVNVLPPSSPKEFAYTILSFTQISKEVSLVCALSFCFLLFFSMHPKPIFLITQKALLLCS